MNRFLICQSFDVSPPPSETDGGNRKPYAQWMGEVLPIHTRYASLCGADYELFVGHKGEEQAASWNRIQMLRDAFVSGYEKVVWFDCDVLVVDLYTNVFTATPDAPLQWTRIPHHDPAHIDGAIRNDGVIVATRSAAAVACLDATWARRAEPTPGYEQFWLDKWAEDRPETFAPLDPRFNWFDWAGGIRAGNDPDYPPKGEAVVLAWHAYDGPMGRFHMMREALAGAREAGRYA